MNSFQPKSKIAPKTAAAVIPLESYETIEKRITSRFEVMDNLTQQCIEGSVRSLFVSGPPGLGKSYGIEAALVAHCPDDHEIVRGFSRATGLYKALYENRHPGKVLLIDDADGIFADPIALNLIKAATDTSKKRWISWRAETKMEDSEGELVATRFEFEGSLIFITNLDFCSMIEKGGSLAPHLDAMIDRSFYLDLEMKTRRDFFVRIRQVVLDKGMAKREGLTDMQAKQVILYVEDNMLKFRTLSIRTAVKLCQLVKAGGDWKKTAQFTLLKQDR